MKVHPNPGNQTVINKDKVYKSKIHECGSKKDKNTGLMLLKKDPTIHITVALLSRIMQNVVDMNNNE